MNRLVRPARLVVLAALAACLVLPLAPQQASACDVSYDYKPQLNLGKPNMGRSKTCSTGTSSVGVVLVAIAAFGALALAGTVVLRRATSLLPTPPGEDQALTDYLQATSLTPHPGPH
ncbi:hypothetical protein [Actinomadura rupiterrae]|uniref:hypothetical protein n=1 Tax=Actinomadura rupiterrae TaxID=559627 RepID=UPI0020A58AF8|nr:hypothetical protein [Actinomadura rupiterrae]MCP2341325.1 hypothetical protein [Actinomadura rupiterrae]